MANQMKKCSGENRGLEVKKKKRGVVIPFILCLLIAVAIWLYASANVDEQDSQGNKVIQNISTLSVFDDTI
ncbi:MAG: hypothetical protein IKA76_03030 [Clostridia bacterium]|nr:hypothetical protein [Clostridia bacterium]